MVNGQDKNPQERPVGSSPVFKGRVQEGRLVILNSRAFNAYMKELEGQEIQLVVRPYARRSEAQNRYYWGVVLPMLGDEFGDTPEGVHEDMKRFLPHGHDSTATLSVQEFTRYLEAVTVFAAQHGIVLPDEGEFE